MKQLYFIAFLSVLFGNAQNISISDVNFEQALISRGIDQGTPDGVINSASALNVTHLDVSNSNITNLTGIEAFTNLVSLDASNNKLQAANFSQNGSLQELILHNNELQSVDVSANTQLQKLNLYKNQLTHIQLNTNTELTYLAIADNYLTDLDLSANTSIEKVFCQNNQLSTLDMSNKPAVTLVNAEKNNISTLSVDNSRSLKQLVVANNYLTYLNVSTNINLESINVLFNNIETLDLSFNSSLTSAFLANNQLSSLNIRNGNNNNLTVLRVENNPDLSCITADDSTVANGIGGTGRWNKDYAAKFSENCGDIVDKNDDFGKNFTVFVSNKNVNIKSTKDAKASVYNLNGVPVVSKDLTKGSQTINMGKFMSNVYVLHIANEQGKYSKKFVLN